MIEHELNTKRLRSIKLQFPQNLIFNELIDCMFAMLNPEQAKYINEKLHLPQIHGYIRQPLMLLTL